MGIEEQLQEKRLRLARDLTGVIVRGVLMVAAAVVLFTVVTLCIIWVDKAAERLHAVKDAKNVVTTSRIAANNKVKLNQIKISQQAQRVKIAEQEAEVRLREARGVKAAQDEIAKTLTPEYIQYEMTKVLADIAKSGKNSSVIYIPVGPDGLPVIANSDARASSRR